MSTLSEIRTDVQTNWPTGYHSADLTDTKVDEFINKVMRWVCRGTIMMPDGRIIMHNFSWLKREVTASTVDEQRRYALPDGTDTPLKFKSEITCSLVDNDDHIKPLRRKLKRDIEEDPEFSDTTESGTPKVYCIDDFDLWLYPLPDHSSNDDTAWTINLEYYGILADLSGDSDTNWITDYYPEVLEYGATELGFRFGMDAELAEYWRQKKIEIFTEMLRADQALELSGLEEGIKPIAGVSLGEGGPSVTGEYWDDDIYD